MKAPQAAIVISSDDSRLPLGATLSNLGFDVTRASGLSEAVSAMEGRRFDLVVADLFLDTGPILKGLMVVAPSPNHKINSAMATAFLHSVVRCDVGLVFDPLNASQLEAAVRQIFRTGTIRPVRAETTDLVKEGKDVA